MVGERGRRLPAPWFTPRAVGAAVLSGACCGAVLVVVLCDWQTPTVAQTSGLSVGGRCQQSRARQRVLGAALARRVCDGAKTGAHIADLLCPEYTSTKAGGEKECACLSTRPGLTVERVVSQRQPPVVINTPARSVSPALGKQPRCAPLPLCARDWLAFLFLWRKWGWARRGGLHRASRWRVYVHNSACLNTVGGSLALLLKTGSRLRWRRGMGQIVTDARRVDH